MSQQITVTSLGPKEYAVRVTEGSDTTDHHVVVPASLLDDLLLDEDDGEQLVRESFSFLLDRTHADAIADDFVLTQLIGEHEDYLEEMRSRLS